MYFVYTMYIYILFKHFKQQWENTQLLYRTLFGDLLSLSLEPILLIDWNCKKSFLQVKPGYGILERKWQMIFRMLDANKDKVMSSADEVLMTDLFVKYFGLKGQMIEPVRRSISLVWRLLLLHTTATTGKSAQMTELEFIRQMWSSYTLRRKMLFTTIMKITDLLLFAADNNKDGYISFPEWAVLFKVLGCHDERAAHFLFQYTGPNYWGYSTILGARQFIMNLILDQDPHYFFKYESILETTGLVSSGKKREIKPFIKPSTKKVPNQKKQKQKNGDNGNSAKTSINSEIQHLLFKVNNTKM